MRLSACLAALFSAWIACFPATATVLYGQVDHSESVEPIASNLRPGDIFSHDNVPAKGTYNQNDWYRIPPWLAGVWHKETQVDYYRYNFLTGTTDTTRRERVARSDGRWGTQQDSTGKIWQFDPVPYSETIDTDDATVIQIVRICDPIEINASTFGKRTMNTQLKVDKRTGRITAAEVGEEITYLTPLSDKMVKRETSSKVFDHNGKAILLGKSESFEEKISEFAPVDSYAGKDVRVLFQEFLKATSARRLVGPNVCFLRP